MRLGRPELAENLQISPVSTEELPLHSSSHQTPRVLGGSARVTPPASVTSSALDALDPGSLDRLRHSVEAGVMAGFQMASAAGPLCDEPLWGVTFEVILNPDHFLNNGFK